MRRKKTAEGNPGPIRAYFLIPTDHIIYYGIMYLFSKEKLKLLQHLLILVIGFLKIQF